VVGFAANLAADLPAGFAALRAFAAGAFFTDLRAALVLTRDFAMVRSVIAGSTMLFPVSGGF